MLLIAGRARQAQPLVGCMTKEERGQFQAGLKLPPLSFLHSSICLFRELWLPAVCSWGSSTPGGLMMETKITSSNLQQLSCPDTRPRTSSKCSCLTSPPRGEQDGVVCLPSVRWPSLCQDGVHLPMTDYPWFLFQGQILGRSFLLEHVKYTWSQKRSSLPGRRARLLCLHT